MKKVIVDIGTGDGRFIYANAKSNPDNFYIGIDPAPKQAEKYQKRVNREKLNNVEFLTGAVEKMPKELFGAADEVYVNFPWGSLLGGIAKAEQKIVGAICSVLKPGGRLEIVFGYSQDAEPSEVKRLGLEGLTTKKIQNEIVPEFEKNGLKVIELDRISKSQAFEIESSWSKKLSFGQERKVFKMVFTLPE